MSYEDDINRFKRQTQKADELNRKIASLEGARNEIVRQLDELGLTPETLDAKIEELQNSIQEASDRLNAQTAALEEAIKRVEAVIGK